MKTCGVDAPRDLLAEDAKLTSDGGGKVTAVPYPLIGRDKVAVFLQRVLALAGGADRVRESLLWYHGAPGFLVQTDGHDPSAYHFEIAEGRITRIYVQRNPDKLARLMRYASDDPG